MGTKITAAHVAGIHSKQPWFVLNAAGHFHVATSDAPEISHFYCFESGSAGKLTVAIPDGCVDILFDCDQSNPSAWVCGSTTEARSAVLNPGRRYVGVRFSAGVTPDFISLSAAELTDSTYDFQDVVKKSEPLMESVSMETEFSLQIRLIKQFLDSKILARQASVLTQHVVDAIHREKGNIRVQHLEKSTGYSRRSLHRQFGADIGMSPKVYSRMIRCQSAVYGIHHGCSQSMIDLAGELGFSDQSHFLREFKKWVSATPREYQNQVLHPDYLARIRLG